jgi:hypothetical protein
MHYGLTTKLKANLLHSRHLYFLLLEGEGVVVYLVHDAFDLSSVCLCENLPPVLSSSSSSSSSIAPVVLDDVGRGKLHLYLYSPAVAGAG